MQRHCTELTERLLKSLDKEYNVVDMGAVVDVITALEKTTITKEVLEQTRLGKHVNELRRKTNNEVLARRVKDLVRRWRCMVLPTTTSTPQPTPADTAPPALNGAKPQSPASRCLNLQNQRNVNSKSPLLKNVHISSPALSIHSEKSRSPIVSPLKPVITTSNHRRPVGVISQEPKSEGLNHLTTEAVPRTHSSNKRLRKEEAPLEPKPTSKRQRINGEAKSSGIVIANSQVPSSPALRGKNPGIVVDVDASKKQQRGRNKDSNKKQRAPAVEDRVKEKLASIGRNPKLKTTQELLADLQSRGSNLGASVGAPTSQSVGPPKVEDVLRGSDAEVSKYLGGRQNHQNRKGGAELPVLQRVRDAGTRSSSKHSESDTHDEDTQDSVVVVEKSEPQAPRERTVEEILAQLPPLDVNAIVWDDDEYEQCGKNAKDEGTLPRTVTDEEVDRLHSECVDGLNGNFQARLPGLAKTENLEGTKAYLRMPANGSDNVEFREWHQMLAWKSSGDRTLHILPYVCVD